MSTEPAPTTARAAPSTTIPADIDPGGGPPRPARLTIVAGWVMVAICLLHTLAFAVHPYWIDWLAGPLRTGAVTLAEAVQFWALPGGFVVPGSILGLLIVRLGRRGQRVPRYVGWVLAGWAAACLWMIGPSGFALVLVPAVLLIVDGLRSPGVSPRGSHPWKPTSRA